MHLEHLLVSYLRDNPVWQDLIKIYEQTWGNEADDRTQQLADVRDLHRVSDAGRAKLDVNEMADMVDYELFDRQTMVRICTMLGFGYPNINDKLFSTEDYLRIAQNIADYYKDQGTDSFIRFFGYCMNTQLDIEPTWTRDYKDFLAEDSMHIGLPVWKGGPWYPTSHVNLRIDVESIVMPDPADLRDFFHYLAPLNLVLLHIIQVYHSLNILEVSMGAAVTILPGRLLPPDTKLDLTIGCRSRVIYNNRLLVDETTPLYVSLT